jgi:hypothetical protein
MAPVIGISGLDGLIGLFYVALLSKGEYFFYGHMVGGSDAIATQRTKYQSGKTAEHRATA